MPKTKKPLKAAPPPPPKKIDVLTPGVVADYRKLRMQAAHFSEQIEKRIEYILETVYVTFGSKLDHWYFDGAEEGELGDLLDHLNGDSVSALGTCPLGSTI